MLVMVRERKRPKSRNSTTWRSAPSGVVISRVDLDVLGLGEGELCKEVAVYICDVRDIPGLHAIASDGKGIILPRAIVMATLDPW